MIKEEEEVYICIYIYGDNDFELKLDNINFFDKEDKGDNNNNNNIFIIVEGIELNDIIRKDIFNYSYNEYKVEGCLGGKNSNIK